MVARGRKPTDDVTNKKKKSKDDDDESGSAEVSESNASDDADIDSDIDISLNSKISSETMTDYFTSVRAHAVLCIIFLVLQNAHPPDNHLNRTYLDTANSHCYYCITFTVHVSTRQDLDRLHSYARPLHTNCLPHYILICESAVCG